MKKTIVEHKVSMKLIEEIVEMATLMKDVNAMRPIQYDNTSTIITKCLRNEQFARVTATIATIRDIMKNSATYLLICCVYSRYYWTYGSNIV